MNAIKIFPKYCFSLDMVTMNSEQSACRRKPGENNDIGGTADRYRSRDNQIDQCNNQNGQAVDKSPSSPTYHITASCAEDTPNYLVYQKVRENIFFITFKCSYL